MGGEGLVVLLAVAFLALKSGLISFNSNVALPAGTIPGTILQGPNGYLQAVQTPNGVVGQPISAAQAQAIASSPVGAITGIATAGATAAKAVSSGSFGFGSIGSTLGSIAIIGGVVAAVIEIARLIFHGADPNQVPAAKTQQVYEAYGLMMQNLYKAGLISQSTCTSLMSAAITGAQQAEANLQQSAPAYAKDPKPFSNAIAGATRDIQAQISTTQGLAPVPLKPLTLAAAQGASGEFPTTNGKWYPGSINLAQQMRDSTVNQLLAAGAQ
jgi:hypothetical protein